MSEKFEETKTNIIINNNLELYNVAFKTIFYILLISKIKIWSYLITNLSKHHSISSSITLLHIRLTLLYRNRYHSFVKKKRIKITNYTSFVLILSLVIDRLTKFLTIDTIQIIKYEIGDKSCVAARCKPANFTENFKKKWARPFDASHARKSSEDAILLNYAHARFLLLPTVELQSILSVDFIDLIATVRNAYAFVIVVMCFGFDRTRPTPTRPRLHA